jgi:hypothetical protein
MVVTSEPCNCNLQNKQHPELPRTSGAGITVILQLKQIRKNITK